MRKDVREFIRRLEAASSPSSRLLGTPASCATENHSEKPNGMRFTLPLSPDTYRWRRAAILDLRKLGIHL